MSYKRKNTFLIAAFVLLCVGLVAYFKTNHQDTVRVGTVVSYTRSICTDDVDTSSCGPYTVAFQTVDNDFTYIVVGYKNKNSNRYDQISKDISQAKEQGATVSLTVNAKSEIVSVH